MRPDLRTFLVVFSLERDVTIADDWAFPFRDGPFTHSLFRLGRAWSGIPNVVLIRTGLSEKEIIESAQTRMRIGDHLLVLDVTDSPPAHFAGMTIDTDGLLDILVDAVDHGGVRT